MTDDGEKLPDWWMLTVPENEDSTRVDRFLRRQVPGLERSVRQWQHDEFAAIATATERHSATTLFNASTPNATATAPNATTYVSAATANATPAANAKAASGAPTTTAKTTSPPTKRATKKFAP